MLFRSHLRTGRSIIGLARSSDGFQFQADPKPFLVPDREGLFADYEEFGVEDPRVTCVDGEYLITYSAYSRHGVRIALAKTSNFEEVEKVSLITEADYRNVVVFPERFNGLYARLDRPHSEISPWSIWISYSPDLRFWGDSQLVMKPEPYHWDEMKIGPGAPPIKTGQGWLSIYHGVFETMAGSVYRLGVALHDLENPAKIIGVGDPWILQPEDPWEVTGYVSNVVLPSTGDWAVQVCPAGRGQHCLLGQFGSQSGGAGESSLGGGGSGSVLTAFRRRGAGQHERPVCVGFRQ